MIEKLTRNQIENFMRHFETTEHLPCPMCGEGCHREIKQVFIGNILQKLIIAGGHLIPFWRNCCTKEEQKNKQDGVGKSLQTIIAESGWETTCEETTGTGFFGELCVKNNFEEVLKSPTVNKLFVELIRAFPLDHSPKK